MLHLTLKIALGVWEYRRGKKFECPWMPKGPRHKLIRRRSKMILLRRGKVLTRAKSQKFLICSIDIIWQKLKLKYNKINNKLRLRILHTFGDFNLKLLDGIVENRFFLNIDFGGICSISCGISNWYFYCVFANFIICKIIIFNRICDKIIFFTIGSF